MKVTKSKLLLIFTATLFCGAFVFMSLRDIQNQPDLRAAGAYPTIPPPPPPVTYIPPAPGAGCSGQPDGASCSTCVLSALPAYGCSTNANGASGNCTANYASWCACDGGGCYPYERVNGCSTSWTNIAPCASSCASGNCVPHNSYCSPCGNSPHVCYTDVPVTCTATCTGQDQHCPSDTWQNGCGYATCTGGTKASGCGALGACSSCSPQCGQGRVQYRESYCGANCPPVGCGTCATSDCGEPSAPQSASPRNPPYTAAAPLIINTATEALSWTDPATPHGFNEWTVKVTRVGVGTSTYHLTPATHTMTTNPLAASALYNWTVSATDLSPCNGISGAACPGAATDNDGIGPTLSGNFCYELAPGQPTSLSPAGTLANPVIYTGTLSAVLRWSAEANHAFTNGYTIVVTNLSTMGTNTFNVASTGTSMAYTAASTGKYSWTITPYNTRCDGVRVNGTTSIGYFTFGTPPILSVLNMRNVMVGSTTTLGDGTTLFNDGTLVTTEMVSGIASPVNQVCQTDFSSQLGHQRDVSFRINLVDNDGLADIDKVGLQMKNGSTTLTAYINNAGDGYGGNQASMTYSIGPTSADVAGQFNLFESPKVNSVGSTSLIVIIPIRFANGFPEANYNLSVYAIDNKGLTITGSDANGWIDGGRDFKVWNCAVPVTGTVYDTSSYADSQLSRCDRTMFVPTNEYNRVPNMLNNVNYPQYPSGAGIATTVNKPASYSSNTGQSLFWGKKYSISFNPEFEIPSAAQNFWTQDVNNVGTTSCNHSQVINIGATTSMVGGITYMVNPYSTQPRMVSNLFGLRNQQQWYQVMGGGVQTNGNLEYGVPATCVNAPGCVPALSINGIGASNSGLVSGANPVDLNGCDESTCFYGYPNDPSPSLNRNWFTSAALVPSFNYNKITGNILSTEGIGVSATGANWASVVSSIGTSGIVFVEGDLTITADVATTSYLVTIVRGRIFVDPTVVRLDGIYISTDSFNASGSNPNQLVINGIVYAGTTVNFTRTYPTGGAKDNNNSPAVLINYKPEYLFLVPQEIFYGLINWSGR